MNRYIDIHEVLKKELEIQEKKEKTTSTSIDTIFNLSLDEFRCLTNPESNIKSAYLHLDSRYASYANNDNTVLTWNFQNNNNIGIGSVNALGDIKEIIGIEIFDFSIVLFDDFYYNDQMIFTVLIPEFSAQSCIGPNRNFHFWGKMTTNMTNIIQQPGYLIQFHKGADTVGWPSPLYRLTDGNEGKFYFNTPITKIDTISLSFASLYNLVPFPICRYQITSIVLSNTSNIIITVSPDVNSLTSVSFCNINLGGNNTYINFVNNPTYPWQAQILSNTQINISTSVYYPSNIIPTQEYVDFSSSYVILDIYSVNVSLRLLYNEL